MSGNVAKLNPSSSTVNMPALAMDEGELISVLTNSIYPGASVPSIKMVLGYCKANGLDPMQKPCHIVPMWDKNTKQMRDVVMPGIGLYRTQAARSGNYAGVTEPEFGPDVIESVGGVEITYPKWCKVIVKRAIKNGSVVEFAATEFWKENYATAGKDSSAPNAMWKKRPYGQIAKCAEAQALRKAFPEFGAAPTADEMEGKEYTAGETIDGNTGEVVNKPAEKPPLPDCTAELFATFESKFKAAIQAGDKSANALIEWASAKTILSDEQKMEIASWETKGETYENA